jgi:hypothetical protein
MSHFPVNGLTGELPDVRTDELLPRGLIRDLNSGPSWREIAFKAPSLPYQSTSRLILPRKYQGIDPDGAF